jgi:HSP20 family protein
MSVLEDLQVAISLGGASTPGEGGADWLPPVDIVETAATFEVTVELCGVPREDISVGFGENRLTVWGVRRPEDDREVHHYRERRMGRFARAFSFRTPVEGEGITARLEQGVLRLSIPKVQPKRVRVE